MTRSILSNTSITKMVASMLQALSGLSIRLRVLLMHRLLMEEQPRELGKVMMGMMRSGEEIEFMVSSISSEATATT